MSEDYDIGYRQPPKSTRFRPGRSGNPRGRPKGSRPIATLVREELDQLVTVSEGGKRTRLRKREVVAKTLVNGAMKGDARAIARMIALLERAGGELTLPPDAVPEELSPADEELLQRVRSKYQG